MWHRDGNARLELQHNLGDLAFYTNTEETFSEKMAFLFSSCCVGDGLGYCLYSWVSWLSRLISTICQVFC